MGSPEGGSGGRPEVDVRLKDVTKRFGNVVAVDDISLEIAKGEFFSLLGPSGCGKTTTLRMIGGFELPDAGEIWLGETNVAGLPAYARDVNTVFQSYALFPHLNVFDNVAYGLRRKKAPKGQIPGRVQRILEIVDLAGFENRQILQLSGGQQQRVALARALVNQPQVLLLDEPLGALDLKLRKQMQIELKGIQHEIQVTFIYVTHDQEEAMTMSNRIAVMRDGRIEQIGAPEDVYELPATEFVAGFLGASNLLDGTAGAPDGRFRTVALSTGEKIRVPTDRLDGHRDRVRVGVRPEKIHLRAEASSEGDNAIEATVVVSTFVGVSNVYSVETKDGRRMTVYAQNLGTSEDRPPAAGDRVILAWHPEHTFVVEPQGGAEGGTGE
jgi:spermidine/putrescine transport system ATP-binding protein